MSPPVVPSAPVKTLRLSAKQLIGRRSCQKVDTTPHGCKLIISVLGALHSHVSLLNHEIIIIILYTYIFRQLIPYSVFLSKRHKIINAVC